MTTLRGWEKNTLGQWCKVSIAALVAAAALAQSPETLARAYRDSPTPARRQVLDSFATAHHDANGALAHLTLGVVAFEQKQYPDAIRHLQAAQARLPKLTDYTAYYLAASRVETGANAAAVHDACCGPGPRAARALPALCPPNPSVLQARRKLAASGSASAAIALLRESYADLPQPDGDLTLAMAYQAANDLPHAVEYYERVYHQYPSGDAATRAAAALLTLHDSMGAAYPAPTAQAMVTRANQLLAQREYARARAEFQSLAPQLNGAERDQARVGIGAADYLNGATFSVALTRVLACARWRSLDARKQNAERGSII